ncbi:MAG: sensor histidine kinase [Planctomycetota bacterium]
MAEFRIISGAIDENVKKSSADIFPFSAHLQLRNARCYILVRWSVVFIFAGLALLAVFGQNHLIFYGVALNSYWLFMLGLVLSCFNLLFWMHLKVVSHETPFALKVNLWGQIVVDLLAVTYVVHRFGSLDTFSPFLYAIHIVIACVFFRPRNSFLVVALCAGLYFSCVFLESFEYICIHSIFTGPSVRHLMGKPRQLLHACSGVAVWGAIWILVGYLSTAVRKRELELIDANKELEEVYSQQQERLRHTSHQMKSPLSAIQSNVALILDGYIDSEVSNNIKLQLKKVDKRCKALSAFISDVLSLAQFQLSEKQCLLEMKEFNFAETVRNCVAAVGSTALKRGIKISIDVEQCMLQGDENAVGMLLDNLLTNAVNYSHDKGIVSVGCRKDDIRHKVYLWVEDRGIGIPEEKISHIFNEYFRTDEAKNHNPLSTGVGLAIAKQVAKAHDADITVESATGEGTKFTISFPVREF